MVPVILLARAPTLQEVISDDLNIEVWSAMMKTTLTEKGHWDVVENGVPPDPSKIPELASSLKVEELCKWRELVRKDMKALEILQSALTDSVFRKTLSATSAKNLWNMLEQVPEYQNFAAYLDDVTLDEDMWMIYSGTTNHMTPYDKYFTTLDRTYRARVRFITGDIAMAEGMGDVSIKTRKGIKMTIKNVLYVPGIKGNALSVCQMQGSGYGVNMGLENCIIWEKTTGNIFGETMLEEDRGFFLRLQVIEGNFRGRTVDY